MHEEVVLEACRETGRLRGPDGGNCRDQVVDAIRGVVFCFCILSSVFVNL